MVEVQPASLLRCCPGYTAQRPSIACHPGLWVCIPVSAGLYRFAWCVSQVSAWSRVVITRSVALAPTLVVALISRAPNQLDVLNQWLNVLQSIQLPFAVIPVRSFTAFSP